MKLTSHIPPDRIFALHEGLLNAEAAASALNHLGRCRKCRLRLSQYNGLMNALSELADATPLSRRDTAALERRSPTPVSLLLAIALGGLAGYQFAIRVPADPSAARGKSDGSRLIGSWRTQGGQPVVFRADGTGANTVDGSRFTWRLEGNALIARRLRPGKPPEPASRTPIQFTRDAKEFRTFLEMGRLVTRFYRLRPDGRIDEHRTKAGGTYPKVLVTPPKSRNGPTVEPTPSPAGRRSPAASGLPAQGPRIQVGPNVQVSRSRAGYYHAEVTLAAHPTDPRRLLAGSMYSAPPFNPAAPKVVVYASDNGGRSWTVSLDRNGADPKTYADPTLAYAPSGDAYFANMYWPSLDATQGRALQIARMETGSRVWTPTALVDGPNDRPFLAVDPADGPSRGSLYCSVGSDSYRVFVSSDGARTFRSSPWTSPPKEDVLMGNPVVLSDGSLVLLYLKVPRTRGHGSALKAAYAAVVRSRDGGSSFSPEIRVGTSSFKDDGRSGLPMLAVRLGQEGRPDLLYAVWPDLRAEGTRVLLSRSTDRGATWSRPLPVSDEPGADGPHDAFLPCVAVNAASVVGVSWYDTRGLPRTRAGWNIRFAVSLNDGRTWLPSVRVSTVSTMYSAAAHRRHPTETRDAYYQPGHTAGLAADARGAFHALWIDGRTGVRQVFAAPIVVLPGARGKLSECRDRQAALRRIGASSLSDQAAITPHT